MPLMAAAVDTESPTRVGMNRLLRFGLLTVLVAVVANVFVRSIALSFITVPAGFWPLGWEAVIGSTVLTAGMATGVYGLIVRYSTRPNRTFTLVATVVLVLSFGSFVAPPPVLASASAPVLATLAAMHVLVAVVSVGILTRAKSNVATSEKARTIA